MHRFFAEKRAENLLYLAKEDIKHFKDVLRIKDDEEVEVYLDGAGYIAVLNSYSKNELSLKIISEIKEKYELSLIHISEPTRQCCTSRMPSSA